MVPDVTFVSPCRAVSSSNLTIPQLSPRTQPVRDARQIEHACLQALVDHQGPEGGWPFTADAKQMAVEPTALGCLTLPHERVRELDAAVRSLLHVQNANGSWPAFLGDDQQGSGYTGLALYALQQKGVQGPATGRAVHWLLHSRGWESHWLWKWKFRTTDRHVRFDPDKFGWPWMPETVSWVFPTTYSLLALRHVHGETQQDLLELRIRRGVEMLYDRICPGGGWNAGNGVVYGSPLAPHADATAVALLALLGEPLNDSITTSLNWLERRAESLFAPWSLAWTILTLHAFRRPTQPWIDRLCEVAKPAEIRDSAALAVVCLALRCTYSASAFEVNS